MHSAQIVGLGFPPGFGQGCGDKLSIALFWRPASGRSPAKTGDRGRMRLPRHPPFAVPQNHRRIRSFSPCFHASLPHFNFVKHFSFSHAPRK